MQVWRWIVRSWLWSALVAGLAPAAAAQPLVYQVDFQSGLQGWTAGFADYPEGQEAAFELGSGHEALPAPLGGSGFFVSGLNGSDDLFMFIKGDVSGYAPNAAYDVTFELTFATDAPSGCVGIGGAPGEGVTVKAGATHIEPLAVSSGPGQTVLMNVDKGNQATGGADAIVVGDFANTQTDCGAPTYELKTVSNVGNPFRASTDEQGLLWLLFATDSGFEGRTSIYYTGAQVTAVPEPAAAAQGLAVVAVLVGLRRAATT